MKINFVFLWTFLCLSPPVIPASIRENTTQKYNINERIKIPQNLYKKCLLKDPIACIGYKIFITASDYFEDSNEENVKPREENINIIMKKEMDDQVDNILLKMMHQYLGIPEDVWTDSDNEVSPRRTVVMSMVQKKMLLPLLLGVVMKLGSLIPLILGKLTFIGLTALMASKFSLLIMGIMGLKKLFSGADGGVSHVLPQTSGHGYQYQDPHVYEQPYQQAYYGDLHGQGTVQVQAPQSSKRVAYVIRGRQFGGEDYWNSPEKSGEKRADSMSEDPKNVSSVTENANSNFRHEKDPS